MSRYILWNVCICCNLRCSDQKLVLLHQAAAAGRMQKSWLHVFLSGFQVLYSILLTFITLDSFMLLDVLSSHALQAVLLSLLLPHSYSFNLSHHPSEFHFLSPKLFLANLWPWTYCGTCFFKTAMLKYTSLNWGEISIIIWVAQTS